MTINAKRLGQIICLIAGIIIYGTSAITIAPQQASSVSIDLGKPQTVVWPFEVSVVGDMGEKGLRIGPKIGRGWLGEAGGEASYKFYVPNDGTYYLWGYCYWYDVCANAVFVQIDAQERTILGNDPLLNVWHWVRGFSVPLSKGTHTLTLSNHSDHISLQKIQFINSSLATPSDSAFIFSELFYDDFEGCDLGNFAHWKTVTGKWNVKHPSQQNSQDTNVLTSQSQDGALIIYEGQDWSDYAVNVAVNSHPLSASGQAIDICFGVQEPDQYYLLRILPVEEGAAKLEILRRHRGALASIIAANGPWQIDKWHKIEVAHDNSSLIASIDGREVINTETEQEISGGIGFGLQAGAYASFDNIHVRLISDNSVEEIRQ